MANPVDPNRVLMTGENSFIRLSPDGGKTQTDRFSHWRVLGGDARRPSGLERVPRVVGDVGEAEMTGREDALARN